jgi:hypothetical protein
MTDLEEKEAMDLETNPEETQSEAVHEVPKEEAAVKPVTALKKRHRGGI